MQSISRIGEPHLKHERVRCNRSFARLVFWLTLNSSRNFFGTLLFPGHSQDCDAVCCCARAAGRPGVVLSQGRAETRTLGRYFTAPAVWSRVSIAEIAIP
jgi:hypothetical protein